MQFCAIFFNLVDEDVRLRLGRVKKRLYLGSGTAFLGGIYRSFLNGYLIGSMWIPMWVSLPNSFFSCFSIWVVREWAS